MITYFTADMLMSEMSCNIILDEKDEKACYDLYVKEILPSLKHVVNYRGMTNDQKIAKIRCIWKTNYRAKQIRSVFAMLKGRPDNQLNNEEIYAMAKDIIDEPDEDDS
jgi:hypothetical protein